MCASPGYPASHGAPAIPEDLVRHEVISFGHVALPATWAFETGGAERRVTFRARLSVDTVDAAIDAGIAAPHAPLPQPYFVPVMSRMSRSASRSVSPSTATSREVSLTRRAQLKQFRDPPLRDARSPMDREEDRRTCRKKQQGMNARQQEREAAGSRHAPAQASTASVEKYRVRTRQHQADRDRCKSADEGLAPSGEKRRSPGPGQPKKENRRGYVNGG